MLDTPVAVFAFCSVYLFNVSAESRPSTPGSNVVEVVAVLDSASALPNTASKYLLGSATRRRTVLAVTIGVLSNVRNSLKAKHRRINGRWFGRLTRIFESKVRRREDLCRVAEIGDDRVFRAAHHKVAHSAPASYEGQRQDDCGEARDRPSFGRRRCCREIAHRHCLFQQTTTGRSLGTTASVSRAPRSEE